ncbi:MAG: hypothetical protein ACREP1_05075 [Rhodanobacteraceae bacterium]
MNDKLFELPPRAQALVRDIEVTIDEAQTLLGAAPATSEAVFSLRETRANYLPQTVAAFVAIPSSQRTLADAAGKTAEDHLLEQLSILDRAVKRDLETLAEQKRADLAVNARFLAERFDDRSTDVAKPGDAKDEAPLPPRVLRSWLPPDTSDAKAIVAHVGAKFQGALPRMTQFGYGGMWGMGRIESVLITLPQPAGAAFRYTLSAKDDVLQASVTKLVHGVSIQTVQCAIGDWMQSLYDDLSAQARHHAETRNALARLVQ